MDASVGQGNLAESRRILKLQSNEVEPGSEQALPIK